MRASRTTGAQADALLTLIEAGGELMRIADTGDGRVVRDGKVLLRIPGNTVESLKRRGWIEFVRATGSQPYVEMKAYYAITDAGRAAANSAVIE